MQLMPSNLCKDQHGFTLIEMAVVMLILTLMVGSLLVPLSDRIKNERYKESKLALQEVREALLGYAVSNGNLPCPDTTSLTTADGVADSPCAGGGEGYLPYITLGMARSDAWNNPLRYRVDPAFTVVITNPLPPANTYIVQNLEAAPATLATDPAAIIFSCGHNGLPDEENDASGANTATCNNPGTASNTYIQDIPHGYPEYTFDDSLIWLSKNTLMNRLVAAGQWP